MSVPNRFIRLLDCDLAITARKDITIEGAKHAFFAIRCSPDIAPTYGRTLINSHGDIGAKGKYVKPALPIRSGWTHNTKSEFDYFMLQSIIENIS